MPVLLKSTITLLVALALAWVGIRAADTTIAQAVSADWPRASGQVRESRVVASDANPFIDELELEYTYRVGTEWIVGDRLTFFGRHLSMLLRVASPDDTAAAFPVGTSIEVAYDPADPTRAVLSPGITTVEFAAAALLILGIAGVSLAMLTHALSTIARLLRAAEHADAAARPARTTRPQARAA